MNTITALANWPFVIGLALGYGGRYAYCMLRSRWLDRHRPLPDGKSHPKPGINRSWVGMVLGICVVAWSIYQIEVTSDRTTNYGEQSRAFAEQVKQCQREFNSALKIRAQIQQENDDLAARDRTALREWLHTLLQPPPNIAKLPPQDPVRQAWGIGVTEQYEQWVASIEEHRQELAKQRAANPLPESTCGK